MKKGFMRLNDDELKFLEKRIEIIDVQKGCPVQCITCGLDAPKYKGSMPWKDFMEITDSIDEVESTKKIELVDYFETIYPFLLSDPIYYHSKDGNEEKTIYDILKTLKKFSSRNIALTTSGWPGGNNYMQRAAEKIIESIKSKELKINFMYSVKTVSEKAIMEYEKYFQNAKGSLIKRHEYAEKKFIEKSIFSKNLTENIRTIGVLASFNAQYIYDKDEDKFLKKYNEYNNLFTYSFVHKLFDTCCEKAGQKDTYYDRRKFSGIGRSTDIGIKTNEEYGKNIDTVNNLKNINENKYNFTITGEGRIQITYGGNSSVAQIIVPKEHFQILAMRNKETDDRYNYTMMAKLQGRSLLE